MKIGQKVATMPHSIRRLNRSLPYRKALIPNRLKQFEVKLIALLWAGIMLLSGLAGQQIYKLYAEDGQRYALSKPSQKLSMTVSPVKLMHTMPAPQTHVMQSMFHANKTETSAEPVGDSRQQEKQRANVNTPQANLRHSLWQLSVQHSELNEWSLAGQLANAKSQLYAGHVEQAGQSFERILVQDPHQVMALAGMLVVVSQRGDIHQREDYLRRLREEIPDYVSDDNLFLLHLAD